jgi:hypothetical protein
MSFRTIQNRRAPPIAWRSGIWSKKVTIAAPKRRRARSRQRS